MYMSQPSLMDIGAEIEFLNEQISSVRRQPRFQKVKQARAESSYVMDPDARVYKRDLETIKSFEEQLKSVQRFRKRKDYQLGTVYAGSGWLMTRALETTKG